jgi:8-oxo-dGTP diphosphatase
MLIWLPFIGDLVSISIKNYPESLKMIEVVAAIIELDKKLLAFKRGQSKYEYVAHKYEFPGGKVENEENLAHALSRELSEELGLTAEVGQFVTTVEHTYPDFSIKMHCFLVHIDSFNGELKEHADFSHVTLKEADNLDWIEADRPVLEIIKQRYAYVFT